MTEVEPNSDSELEYPKGVTDEVTCLDYLKKKEVFLYKMMNDPSHKAMLYFLEVLMNSEAPVTIEQLAARFSHKTFSPEMREACGGGSPEGLRDFLLRYPSLFNVGANGQVNSVAIELPGNGGFYDGLQDFDCWSFPSTRHSSISNDHIISKPKLPNIDVNKDNFSVNNSSENYQRKNKAKSVSSLSLTSNVSSLSSSLPFQNNQKNCGRSEDTNGNHKKRISLNQLSENSQSHELHRCDTSQKCCDSIGSMGLAPSSTNPCAHCSLVELTCHHHHHPTACAITHHHHVHHATTTTTHCICANPRMSCVSVCHQCPTQSTQSNQYRSNTSANGNTVCALPPLEQLTLETEAVRFFQQRLLKKEERWVQIKSLAGHLSQARADIRAVVGPQLEFRNFLLRHPHVFEVQGELVSVRDPFGSLYPSRKDHGFHNSHSSSNLFPQGSCANTSGQRHIRQPRPKSLILPSNRGITFTGLSRAATKISDFEKSIDQSAADNVDSWFNKQLDSTHHTPTGTERNAVTPTQQNRKSFAKSSQAAASFDNSLWEKTSDRLSASKSINSLSISMSANEYKSVMFVRKVLEKRGGASNQPGLPFSELLRILSESSPEPVRCTIGWTKVEVEEFLNQHHLFFEVCTISDQSNSTISKTEELTQLVVKNKRLEKMINIIITGTKAVDSTMRSLTNHCGHIYHVTKLWGIIDLGKHEHVFFDKSIFKHIDDLQKHFKVGELLYFNAILAPKESRAKWRATQVWKECDRQAMEKMNMPGPVSETPRCINSVNRTRRSQNMANMSQLECNSSSQKSGFGGLMFDDEDTDAEGEIEEIDIASLSLNDGPNKQIKSQEYQCEFALNGDEEIEDEEPYVSAVARQEGLNLVNDVKFISDMQTSYHEPKSSEQLNQHDQTPNSNGSYTGKQNEQKENDFKNQFVSSSTENAPSECAYSYHSGDGSCDASSKHDMVKSTSSTDSCSIAVQTLSTGEIMATNLYHDQNKHPCPSGC